MTLRNAAAYLTMEGQSREKSATELRSLKLELNDR